MSLRVDPGGRLHGVVTSFIQSAWGTNKGRFPGPQPVSIERRHFPLLTRDPYVVCEKTDGERHMLVCVEVEKARRAVLVNRALEMRVVPLTLPPTAYKGTILDGEVYGGTMLVYDALFVDGAPVGQLFFLDRLEKIENLLKRMIVMKFDMFKLRLKTFHVVEDMDAFIDDYLPSVQEDVDGLVFTPVNEPMRIGTHETMFKWKPQRKNTVDFALQRDCVRKGVWRLYVQDKGQLVYESETLQEEDYFEEGAIVECEYVPEAEAWRAIKRRLDKTYPNNRRTFYATLRNIRENIQMEEFRDLFRM
jgi:hypothetical protein